ncbi:hypothetical protein ACEK07_20840 [Alcanivoracaceae bacterium MT1]
MALKVYEVEVDGETFLATCKRVNKMGDITFNIVYAKLPSVQLGDKLTTKVENEILNRFQLEILVMHSGFDTLR